MAISGRLYARRRPAVPLAQRCGARRIPARLASPVVLAQLPLAQPQVGRRDLDQLIGGDELDRRLQGHRRRRRQAQRLVVAVGADVGQLLFLGRVDVHVAGPAVLADDHALVDLYAGADEQRRPLLQVEQPVGVRRPGAVADQHAAGAVGHVARPRPVALADLVQQRGAARLGQQLAAVADQAARPG